MAEIDEGLLTKRETCDLLRVSPRMLERLTARGAVPSLKIGRCRFYRRRTLDVLIAHWEGEPAKRRPLITFPHCGWLA